MLHHRAFTAFLLFSSSIGLSAGSSIGPAGAENLPPQTEALASEAVLKNRQMMAGSLRLAGLPGRIPSIDRNPKPDQSRIQRGVTTHISLVLVGDTGYAPSRTRPKSTGVSKHGSWQTWQQTTRDIRDHINGDINFANMESVVSANGGLRARPKAFNFMTHPNGVRHLVDVGFNLFSMANNHSFDYGASGIRDSLMHMDELAKANKIAHAGIGLNRQQASAVPVFERKKAKFAFGAIGIGASSGGLPRATKKRPGQLNIYNNKDNDLLMGKLADAPAEYRILSVHRGIERNVKAGGGEISRIRRRMLDQGNVDLLIGHHAHVARGMELNNGRLVFYGLGNFLHQGTANMAGSGGCRDYSILAKVHLVKRNGEKPQLAAVEVVPLTQTHLRPKPMASQKGARRIAVLNGLASQFDDKRAGAKGIRFAIRENGTGLYCTTLAKENETTRDLCNGYQPFDQSHAKIYRTALNTCGRSFGRKVFAKLRSSVPVNEPVKIAALGQKQATLLKSEKSAKAVEIRVSKVKTGASSSKKKVAALRIKKLPTKKTNSKRAKKNGSVLVKKASYVSKKRLSNRQLARMTRAQRKRYWTRYWYIKRGRKIPNHLR